MKKNVLQLELFLLIFVGVFCIFCGCKKVVQLCYCYEIHVNSADRITVFEFVKWKELLIGYIALEHNGRKILLRDRLKCEDEDSVWKCVKAKKDKYDDGKASALSLDDLGLPKEIVNFVNESREQSHLDEQERLSGICSDEKGNLYFIFTGDIYHERDVHVFKLCDDMLFQIPLFEMPRNMFTMNMYDYRMDSERKEKLGAYADYPRFSLWGEVNVFFNFYATHNRTLPYYGVGVDWYGMSMISFANQYSSPVLKENKKGNENFNFKKGSYVLSANDADGCATYLAERQGAFLLTDRKRKTDVTPPEWIWNAEPLNVMTNFEWIMNSENPQARLFLACAWNDIPMAEQALIDGADVNTANPGGRTPLMQAVLYENPGMVRWLREHGADTEIENANGETAFFYLKQNAHEMLAELNSCNFCHLNKFGENILMRKASEGWEGNDLLELISFFLNDSSSEYQKCLTQMLRQVDNTGKNLFHHLWKKDIRIRISDKILYCSNIRKNNYYVFWGKLINFCTTHGLEYLFGLEDLDGKQPLDYVLMNGDDGTIIVCVTDLFPVLYDNRFPFDEVQEHSCEFIHKEIETIDKKIKRTEKEIDDNGTLNSLKNRKKTMEYAQKQIMKYAEMKKTHVY